MSPVVPSNTKLKEISKKLRRNATEAEKRLWEQVRQKRLGYVFYRQKPIGDYIVDFFCNQTGLVVEVDGDYHDNIETAQNDKVRDETMRNLKLTVLRFSNSEVLDNIDKVVNEIRKQLEKSA